MCFIFPDFPPAFLQSAHLYLQCIAFVFVSRLKNDTMTIRQRILLRVMVWRLRRAPGMCSTCVRFALRSFIFLQNFALEFGQHGQI